MIALLLALVAAPVDSPIASSVSLQTFLLALVGGPSVVGVITLIASRRKSSADVAQSLVGTAVNVADLVKGQLADLEERLNVATATVDSLRQRAEFAEDDAREARRELRLVHNQLEAAKAELKQLRSQLATRKDTP